MARRVPSITLFNRWRWLVATGVPVKVIAQSHEAQGFSESTIRAYTKAEVAKTKQRASNRENRVLLMLAHQAELEENQRRRQSAWDRGDYFAYEDKG